MFGWFKRAASAINDALPVIAKVLAVAAAVVGVLAIFLPVLAPLALALGALVLVLDSVLVATGRGSWVDVALGVLGLATFGLGHAFGPAARAGRAAKDAPRGVAAARTALRAQATSHRGAATIRAASPAGSPVRISFSPATSIQGPPTARPGGAGPVRVGQQGLDALGVTQNTTRIALPGGRYRVPDILDEAGGVIGEVKNVRNLSYTAQLRDYVAYAQANQLQFDLYVRGSTRLSGPLQQAVHGGVVNLWARLPG